MECGGMVGRGGVGTVMYRALGWLQVCCCRVAMLLRQRPRGMGGELKSSQMDGDTQ